MSKFLDRLLVVLELNWVGSANAMIVDNGLYTAAMVGDSQC